MGGSFTGVSAGGTNFTRNGCVNTGIKMSGAAVCGAD